MKPQAAGYRAFDLLHPARYLTIARQNHKCVTIHVPPIFVWSRMMQELSISTQNNVARKQYSVDSPKIPGLFRHRCRVWNFHRNVSIFFNSKIDTVSFCFFLSLFFCILNFLPAFGRPVMYPRIGASSAISAHPPQSALPHDGSSGLRGWVAAGAAPQWLVIDLGQLTELHSVVQEFPSVASWRFVIEGSDSGSTAQPQEWRRLAIEDGSKPSAAYEIKIEGTARYVRLTVLGGGQPASNHFEVRGTPETPTVSPSKRAVTLAPLPADAPIIVAQSCDLWSSQAMWDSVITHQPGDRPLSGLYNDADPAVTDARIQLALSAGIDAFQSCWFRQKGNAGQPVIAEFEGVIRAFSATASRRLEMRWSLFWDNANPAADGVSGTGDFLDHVVRFWIDAYLTQPNYLRVHGRPLIVIGHPEVLAAQLGGPAQARRAILEFRARAIAAGAGNPLILGCNNANPSDANMLGHAIGLDGVMAYATPIFTGLLHTATPTTDDVITAHDRAQELRRKYSLIPPTQTVSVGYDARAWSHVAAGYRLPPSEFARLLRRAISATKKLPPDHPGHNLIFLDNWNEYGEDHFFEPSVAYGRADLDAIRDVLKPSPGAEAPGARSSQ